MVNDTHTRRRSVNANLEVVVLAFLFGFQVESSQTSEILLTHGLIDRGSTTNTLTVVVSRVCPPVSFRLHVAQDHVLNWRWQTWHLPRDVSLPAAPRFTQVLQDRPRFVLFYAFGHHVENVMHHLNTPNTSTVTTAAHSKVKTSQTI